MFDAILLITIKNDKRFYQVGLDMMNQSKMHFIVFGIFILVVFLIAFPGISRPQVRADRLNNNNREIIHGIHLLYDWEFDRAEKLFSGMFFNNSKDPAPYFYYAMVSWSRLASGFWNRKYVDQYDERIDKTISVARAKIETGNAENYAYFYLGGALGFKGRFALMERKWFSSFNLAYKAIEALKTCQRMDPANKDVLLGLGIYDYYTARLSGVMKFFSSLFISKGNKKEGLRKLHAAADEAIYSRIEAKSMLIHIYLFLESGYREARPLTEDLAARFKNNPRYKFLQGITYLQLGMMPEYRNVVDDFMQRSRIEPSKTKAVIWKNRAVYLQASDCLFRNQYGKARTLLDSIRYHADPLTDPSMIAWPLIKIGMSHDFEGKRQKALVYYKRILEMENGAGAQFLAEKFIAKPPPKGDPFIGY